MFPTEFFAIITMVIGGMSLAGFTIHRITDLIRFRMERKYSGKTPELEQVMKQNQELVQWRIKAEKRIQSLEAIAAQDGGQKPLLSQPDTLMDLFEEQDERQPRSVPNQLRNR